MNRASNTSSNSPKAKNKKPKSGSADTTQPNLKLLRRHASCSLLFSIIVLACNLIPLLTSASLGLFSDLELLGVIPNIAAFFLILAQVFAVLAIEEYLKAKRQHLTKIPPVGLTAIITCGLVGLFAGYGLSVAVILIISFIIINAAVQRDNPSKFLLNAVTIVSLICGILILLAWTAPLFMSQQMSGAGADGFGLILELVYSPFYSILRVEAAVPVVLGFVSLARVRHAQSESNILRLVLIIIAAIMVLSPVFYNLTRKTIQSNSSVLQNKLTVMSSSGGCNGIPEKGKTFSDSSLSYYAEEIACAYLYYQYVEHAAPTNQAEVLKYLPDDFLDMLESGAEPKIVIGEDLPSEKYVFDILPHRECSLENTASTDKYLSVWVRNPSKMTLACGAIYSPDDPNFYDLEDTEAWYAKTFGDPSDEGLRDYSR